MFFLWRWEAAHRIVNQVEIWEKYACMNWWIFHMKWLVCWDIRNNQLLRAIPSPKTDVRNNRPAALMFLFAVRAFRDCPNDILLLHATLQLSPSTPIAHPDLLALLPLLGVAPRCVSHVRAVCSLDSLTVLILDGDAHWLNQCSMSQVILRTHLDMAQVWKQIAVCKHYKLN